MDDGRMLSRWDDRAELESLWRICFGEERRPANFFFNNCFRPEYCALYREDGKIAAALYLLPARLVQNLGDVPAHYIYGAATLPEFRSRGIMGKLLEFSAEEGRRRGDIYSFLLPAEASLYGYYEKHGYRSVMQVRKMTMSCQELTALAGDSAWHRELSDFRRIRSLREEILETQSGSPLWDEKMISYTVGINRVYGGKLLCAGVGQEYGYALCRNIPEGCEVTELMSQPSVLPILAAGLLTEMPALTYHIRQPVNGLLFSALGQAERFGMMKPLSQGEESMRENCRGPYLGMMPD